MKKISIIILLALSCSLAIPSLAYDAQPVSWDLVTGQYVMVTQEGDYGTLYFTSDGSAVWLPSPQNQKYRHICWSRWKLKEETQVLTVKGANLCRFIRGEYLVYQEPEKLILQDGDKMLVLQRENAFFIYP